MRRRQKSSEATEMSSETVSQRAAVGWWRTGARTVCKSTVEAGAGAAGVERRRTTAATRRTMAMAPEARRPGRARFQGKASGAGAEASRATAVITDSAKPEDGRMLSLPGLRA